METIEVYELNARTNSRFSECMSTYVYQNLRSLFDIVQGHSDLYFKTFATKLLNTSKSNFMCLFDRGKESLFK